MYWFLVLLLFILVVLLFLSVFSNDISVSSAIVTPFLNDGLPLKFGFFSYIQNFSDLFE